MAMCTGDEFYFQKDCTNTEVIHYQEDENRYYDEIMHPLGEQTEQIYLCRVVRAPDSEVKVPV
jgi:oligopeptidase B